MVGVRWWCSGAISLITINVIGRVVGCVLPIGFDSKGDGQFYPNSSI